MNPTRAHVFDLPAYGAVNVSFAEQLLPTRALVLSFSNDRKKVSYALEFSGVESFKCVSDHYASTAIVGSESEVLFELDDEEYLGHLLGPRFSSGKSSAASPVKAYAIWLQDNALYEVVARGFTVREFDLASGSPR